VTRTVAAPTRSTLADGREILFFALAAPPRIHEDRRDLPARAPGSPTELRFDTQLGDWVMMAPTRQERTYKPPRTMCPLCPDADGLSSEIPANGYDVAVFENRFPSLSSARAGSGFILPPPAGYGTAVDGYGRCEVVCFSSDHDGSFSKLTARHARLVIDAWTERTRDLLGRDGIEEVHCFENRGEEIGVTLSHPHGQIYAYPFLTHRTATVLTRARGHRHATGRNLFSDIIARETEEGERVIVRTEHVTAFVPFAARWPAEVHIYPNRHCHNLTELTDAEADDLARVYLTVLRAYDALYDCPLPYIASWHQYRSTGDERSNDTRSDSAATQSEGYLHAEMFSVRRSADKLKYLAGSESARDAFVTDKLPEQVATDLREAIARTGELL